MAGAKYGPPGLCNCPCEWYFIWIVQFATQLTAELRFGIVIFAIITVHRCPNIFIILKTLIKKQLPIRTEPKKLKSFELSEISI